MISGHLISKTFDQQTNPYDMTTEQVSYSDPYLYKQSWKLWGGKQVIPVKIKLPECIDEKK